MTPDAAASDLDRNRRTSARAALYLSLATVALASLGLWAWLGRALSPDAAVDWNRVDYAELPEVELLQRYIAIDSTPEGGTVAAAEWLAGELRAAGVEPTVERLGERDANLWAVLEGDDPRAIVLHHHMDVEAVGELGNWRRPPFAGTIEGPWIYGRGAFDMKSVGIAQLEAFRRLAGRGRRPARSVILLATADEESGSHLGMRWLLANRPELVERFALVLTEGGAVEGRSPEEVKYWGTEFAQKRVVEVVVCGAEREPLDALRSELVDSGRGLEDLRVTPEVTAFLRHYAPTRDREDLRQALADPAMLVRDLPAFEELPGYLQSMFRDEAVPFEVQAGEEGGWELRILLHLLPGSDLDQVRARLLPPWRLHGLGLTVYDEGGARRGSDPEAAVVAAIGEALHRRYPEIPAGPLFLPWIATDSRFLRARGVPSYGFSPFMVLTPEVMTLVRYGSANERIALPGFVAGVELYGDLLERLAD